MLVDLHDALAAYPVAALIIVSALAFAFDRTLRRAGRRLDHFRGHRERISTTFAAALALVRLLARLTRVAVWLALAWVSGEISPSLMFLRDFIYVVGTTAITAPVVMLNQHDYSILDFIELPIAIALAWLFVKTSARIFETRLDHSGRVDAGTRQTLTLLARCALGFAAGLVILNAWGVDLKSLTLAASVIGVGVGFGLQNVTSNFVSGLLVSLERPIRPGDFVNVGALTGTVERIGLRSTEIVTLDRVSILVPNSVFLEKEVVNWSHGDPVYRLHVPIGVDYDSDVAVVRDALLEAAATHRAVLHDPKPRVEFRGFGASALDFVLLVWARDPKQQSKLLSDMNYRVEASLRARSIRIPFPQLDLNVRSPARVSSISTAFDLDATRADAGGTGVSAEGTSGVGVRFLPTNGFSGRPDAAHDLPLALAGAFDEVSDTHAWTDSELRDLTDRMHGSDGVDVEDRRYRLRIYARCFIGSDAVDWMVKALALNRKEAVELGNLLVSRHLIHHVTHDQPFKDGPYFYRFESDAQVVAA